MLLEHPALFCISRPVNVLVPYGMSRNRIDGVTFHTARKHPPSRGFLKASAEVFYACPEYCFLQMAGVLSLPELVELGYELCGTYVRDARSGGRTVYGVKPATAPTRLASFLRANRGYRGSAPARRALQYVSEGSNSPMESILAMMLCLPMSLGGYGLPRPVLNGKVTVRMPEIGAAARYCDLYWPDLHLAFEYDSDEFHPAGRKWQIDSARRVELGMVEVEVVSVGRMQIEDAKELEKLARLLCNRAGLRTERGRFEDSLKRVELHRALMPWI